MVLDAERRAGGQEVELAGDGAARRGAGEEIPGGEAVEVDEDAADPVREEQAPVVDDGAPRLADRQRDAARSRGARRLRTAANTSSSSSRTRSSCSCGGRSPSLPDDRAPPPALMDEGSRSM